MSNATRVRFFKIGDYDSRMGSHSYAMYTTGTNYLAVYNGEEFKIGFRRYDRSYLQYNNISTDYDPIEISLEDVPNKVIAATAKHFGIFLMKESDKNAINLERCSIIAPDPNDEDLHRGEFYTHRQVELLLDGFELEPAITSVSKNDYHLCKTDKYPKKDIGKLFTSVNYSYFSTGWNSGSHYNHYELTPWKQTKWGSREAKLAEEIQQMRLDAEKAKAEEKVRAEMEAKIAEEKRQFAQMCGRKALKYSIPFSIALAFKGNDDEILLFLESLKQALSFPYDEHELQCGRARNSKEMKKIGLYTGSVDTNRLKDYVLNCLKSEEIISD